MKKQVDKNVYNFQKYCGQSRWISYWHQVNEVLKINPKSILEVGVGDKFLENYLKANTAIEYKSLDIAEDLKPDVLGSVDNIPVEDNSFDMVCAFEILEHLPFEKFEKSLGEIHRVSKKNVLISLPHWGRHFSIDIRLPYLKRLKWMYKFDKFPIEHKVNNEHYWEIGKKGYSLNKIKKIIKKFGFEIVNDYLSFETPYHHFFVLNK